MAKKLDSDKPTRRIAERLLDMPPKPHQEMKFGKTKNAPKNRKSGQQQRGAFTRANLALKPAF
jgi:hypothetical protein